MVGKTSGESMTLGERVILLNFGITCQELRKNLSESIVKLGSKKAFSSFISTLDRFLGDAWFAKNRVILTLLDLEGLLGYDGQVTDILDELNESSSFEEVKVQFTSLLFLRIKEQLKTGCYTHFYEPTLIVNSAGAILHDEIIQARRIEFLKAVKRYKELDDKGGFDDDDYINTLGRSSIGFDILCTAIDINSLADFQLIESSIANALTLLPDISDQTTGFNLNGKNTSEKEAIIQNTLLLFYSDCEGLEKEYNDLLDSGFIDPLIAEEAMNYKDVTIEGFLNLSGCHDFYRCILIKMAKSEAPQLVSRIYHILTHDDYPKDNSIYVEIEEYERIWEIQDIFLKNLLKRDEQKAVEFAGAILANAFVLDGGHYPELRRATISTLSRAITLLREKGNPQEIPSELQEFLEEHG